MLENQGLSSCFSVFIISFMAYIGWANNVNKLILDSTTVTVGDGATVKDALETGGLKKSRLACASPADKYSVEMAFSFADESRDASGFTELERFYRWFKYEHRYGVNPFKFPAILINSNRVAGYSDEERGYIASTKNNREHREDITKDDIPDYEYYVITSAVEGSKRGLALSIKMTWETRATASFIVPATPVTIDHIEADNGCVQVTLSAPPASEPVETDFTLLIAPPNGGYAAEAITACVYDGELSVRLYFEEKTAVGVYAVKVNGSVSSFEVEA